MLTINNLTKRYQNKTVLYEMSLNISEGICYGIVGPNGAGKSTLMKIIASILTQSAGEICMNQERFTSKHRQSFGYVPQEICLEHNVSARQNLYYFGKLYGLRGRELRDKTKQILSQIGLLAHADHKVSTFSGGMKRRLNIGCALIHDPTFIILDEPTVGIDPQSRRYIFEMIESLKKSGRTIIYTSHYMEEVEKLCDEVAFIDQGKIIEHGTIDSLMAKYSTPSIFVKGKDVLPDHLLTDEKSVKEQNGYKITDNEPLKIMKEIIIYCEMNHRVIDRLELIKPRLEEVFFILTGNQLREEIKESRGRGDRR